MAHMHVTITFILVFGLTCTAARLLEDPRKGGMGSASNWHRNPFYQREISKLSNGSSGSGSNLGKLRNTPSTYRVPLSNYHLDPSMWQFYQRFNYPMLYYIWQDYNQRHPLGSTVGTTKHQVRPSFGANNNFNRYIIDQGALRAKYPTANNQPNLLGSMLDRINRPMGLNFGGNYNNPNPSAFNQASTRTNYPSVNYGMVNYIQRNAPGSTSETAQRPMGWNFGENHYNPIPVTMNPNSPRSNYPPPYYGQRNALGSTPGSIQRPVGWPFKGNSKTPIHSSTKPDYSKNDKERNSTQSKPFNTISHFIPHPVGWPFGAIYSYGGHMFQHHVRYYGYTLGSPLVLTYRVLYPKRPVVNDIPHNIPSTRDVDRSVSPYPFQSSRGSESNRVSSPGINGGRTLGYPVGQPISPVSHDRNILTASDGLGFRSPHETSAVAPGTQTHTGIRPIVILLGNLNSEHNNNFPTAPSFNRNLQNKPNDFGQNSANSGLNFNGNRNYPTGDPFNINTPGIGRNPLNPSYATQNPVGQSVNRGSYAIQDPYAHQRSPGRGGSANYEGFKPTQDPSNTFSQYNQSPDFNQRFGLHGPTQGHDAHLPLSVIYFYPKPETYKSSGNDS